MKLNSKILGVIILVVIFGGIALSSALGYWNTEGGGGGHGRGSSETADGGGNGRQSDEFAGGGGSGRGHGQSGGGGGAAVIRGRTTFQDLLNLGLPQATIERVIGGPMPDPSMHINAYCNAHNRDFEAVKEALQAEVDKLSSGP